MNSSFHDEVNNMKIVNVSGEPRELKRDRFIYEFPYPAYSPTEVPDELGRGLVSTGQFKEFHDVDIHPDLKKYRSELIALAKIGTKWADTIIRSYPTRDVIVSACKDGSLLLFGKDINEILLKHFGG